MTTPTPFPLADLVLRLSGGSHNGTLIPIGTHKCLLRIKSADSQANGPHCAFFRGPQGTVVRSYSDQILVNGAATTVHWLRHGDRIELPNSQAFEVAHLGETHSEPSPRPESEIESGEPELKVEFDSEFELATGPELEIHFEPESELEPAIELEPVSELEPESTLETVPHPKAETLPVDLSLPPNPPAKDDLRLDSIESQIREIRSQNDLAQSRFNQVDDRLIRLMDQLNQLVSIAHEVGPANLHVTPENALRVAAAEIAVENQDLTREPPAADPESCHVANDQPPVSFEPTPPIEDEEVASLDEPTTTGTGVESEIQSEIPTPHQHAEVVSESVESESVANDPEFELDPEPAPELEPELEPESASESVSEPGAPVDPDSELPSNAVVEVNTTPEQNTDPDSEPDPAFESDLETEADLETDADPASESDLETDSGSESSSKNESVSELLARMKDEGQWGGLPADDDTTVDEVTPIETPTEPEPIAELESNANDEGEIQDYLSKLLARMQVEPTASKADEEPTEEEDGSDQATVEPEKPAEPEFVEPVNVLKADEFVPQQKAEKIESLGAMRELANSSARTAVQTSNASRRKSLGLVQLGIAASSFLMAIYYFLVASHALFDTGFCLGMLCVATSGFIGIRYYSAMKHDEIEGLRSTLAKRNATQAQKPRSS